MRIKRTELQNLIKEEVKKLLSESLEKDLTYEIGKGLAQQTEDIQLIETFWSNFETILTSRYSSFESMLEDIKKLSSDLGLNPRWSTFYARKLTGKEIPSVDQVAQAALDFIDLSSTPRPVRDFERSEFKLHTDNPRTYKR